MLTAVDHVVVGVPDLEEAVDTYRRLGFSLTESPGRALARAFFGDFYLELRESDTTEGVDRVVFRSDDLAADRARLAANGIAVTESVDGMVGVETPVPMGIVERGTTSDDAAAHPNTATALERIYVAVESIEDTLGVFEKVLGMAAPEPELGTVIMSLMSVFYLGPIGIAVAEPRGPGPTADALAANGAGWFQLLFRADHLDVAAALMVDRGIRPPQRGTRLSGESALLVEPDQACNVYVALAGQP